MIKGDSRSNTGHLEPDFCVFVFVFQLWQLGGVVLFALSTVASIIIPAELNKEGGEQNPWLARWCAVRELSMVRRLVAKSGGNAVDTAGGGLFSSLSHSSLAQTEARLSSTRKEVSRVDDRSTYTGNQNITYIELQDAWNNRLWPQSSSPPSSTRKEVSSLRVE